ncbi:NUDIX domain-containing protein [Kitasatospora sp. NPDC054939]
MAPTESADWLPRADWLAGLPLTLTIASAPLTDHHGRVLIVKAGYRDEWSFPGGVLDPGERPDECARRELREETGLALEPLGLLAVSWDTAVRDSPHAAAAFVFDFGTIPHEAPITLQASELTDYRWVVAGDCADLVGPSRHARLRAALSARAHGGVQVLGGHVI